MENAIYPKNYYKFFLNDVINDNFPDNDMEPRVYTYASKN